MFKILFLTTFISNIQLLYQIWNNCVRFFSNLKNFGNSWGENDASWKIYQRDQCCLNDNSDNFYFDYKTVQPNLTETKSYDGVLECSWDHLYSIEDAQEMIFWFPLCHNLKIIFLTSVLGGVSNPSSASRLFRGCLPACSNWTRIVRRCFEEESSL